MYLEEHQRSGLSATKYALSKGLNASSFYNWHSKRNKQSTRKVTKPENLIPNFVKVKIEEPETAPQKASTGIYLRLTSGQMMEFSNSVSPEYLARFVRALN